MLDWLLGGLNDIVDKVLYLVFGGFITAIKNALLDFLDTVLQIVTGFSIGLWDSILVQSALAFISTIAFFMWVVALIFVLNDVAEDLHNQNPIPYMIVLKNICVGFIYSASIVGLTSTMFAFTIRLTDTISINLIKDGNTFDSVLGSINGFFDFLLQSTGGNTNIFLLFIIVTIIAVCAYLYFSVSMFAYMFIHSVLGSLYVIEITRGNTTTLSGWYRTALSYCLGYVIQTYLFKSGVALLLSSNGLLTSFNTYIGFAFIVGMFITPKALGKYGNSYNIARIGSSAMNIASTAGRVFGK